MAGLVSNLTRKVRLRLAEDITEVFIGARRPSGMVSLTYVGRPPTSDVPGAVQRALEEFIDECHSAFICYFGAVMGMDNTKDILAQEYERNSPVTIEFSDNDATDLVRTRILGNAAIEMFSSGGRFERLQSRSLVIAIFTEWEAVTRRKLATLLGVKTDDIKSDLLGGWRCLRNWLVHKDGDAEEQYFDAEGGLAGYLGSRRGEPEVTTPQVFKLMDLLSSLLVIVNPDHPDNVEPYFPSAILNHEQRLQPRQPL